MASAVVWLPAAELNLYDQLDYLETRNARAASDLATKVIEATTRLSHHPQIGRVGRKANTRELVLTGTPFLLVYRVEPQAIVILRFLHGAQRWPGTGDKP